MNHSYSTSSNDRSRAATAAREHPRRIDYVDTVRGLTCLLVCLFHAIGDSPQHGLRVPVGSEAWTLARLIDVVNMPLFTFVAGRVFSLDPTRPGGLRWMVGRRLPRLLIPFATVTVLWIVAVVALGTVAWRDTGGFFLHARGHLWFLQALAWLTCAATFGFLLFPRATVEFAGVSTVVSLAAAVSLSTGETSLLSWNAAFDLAPFYFLGLFAGAAQRAGHVGFEGSRSPLLTAVLVGLLGAGIVFTALEPDPFLALRGPTANWYPTSLPILGLVMTWAPTIGILKALSRYSYTIYLLHVFAMAAVRMPLKAVAPQPPLVPAIVGLVIVGVVVPIALHRVIEKHRILRFLFHGTIGRPSAVMADRPV